MASYADPLEPAVAFLSPSHRSGIASHVRPLRADSRAGAPSELRERNTSVNPTVRPIASDEAEAFLLAEGSASGEHPGADAIRRERSILEPERTIAAFDGDRIVGGAGALTFEMTVPGARLPTGGVAWVNVLPTHRRKGIMTHLMRQLLDDIHAKGEPLAALFASESIIYGRFGFGAATFFERWSIERPHTAFAHKPEELGKVELVGVDDALTEFPHAYEIAVGERPGMMPRSDAFWKYRLWDSEDRRGGATAMFHAGYRRDGRLDGYALYRIHHGRRALVVVELVANTDEAHAALWSYCFGVDLMARAEASIQPVDDPLPWMLADPRRLERSMGDGLWLRLVDVEAALAGRRYAVEGSLILDVVDSFCPWNHRRYRLEGGPDGSSCRPSGEPADLTLSAADLAAAYLGGVKLGTLSRAGRVQAATDKTLKLADAMFATPKQPWCIHDF